MNGTLPIVIGIVSSGALWQKFTSAVIYAIGNNAYRYKLHSKNSRHFMESLGNWQYLPVFHTLRDTLNWPKGRLVERMGLRDPLCIGSLGSFRSRRVNARANKLVQLCDVYSFDWTYIWGSWNEPRNSNEKSWAHLKLWNGLSNLIWWASVPYTIRL